MSDDRTVPLILAVWGRQGWMLSPEEREEGIKRLTSKPRYNDDGQLTWHGGRYCDFDARACAVSKLVNDRRSGLIGDEEYRMGLYRSLPFLTPAVRAEIARDLLEGH
jgi:hypothetical protein